jgi:hypothetical protein
MPKAPSCCCCNLLPDWIWIGKSMTKDEALEKKAENARELGLDYEPEPLAFINVEQRKLEWAKYMTWNTPTVANLPKIPLYTTPPQRTWVGLTNDELTDLFYNENLGQECAVSQAIALLKERNT